MTKSLTAVFAHPDDESVTIGATLARYADEGVRTSVVLATKGEVGEIAVPDLATPENLGEVREAEVRRACEILGVAALHFLGYRDGEVPHVDRAEAAGRILDVFEAERPDVVITFGSEGIGGHPDHIHVGELTTEAFHRYRGERPDARLFYSATPRELVRDGMAALRAQGVETGGFDIDFDTFGTPVAEITTKVDTTGYGDRKVDALLAHVTQTANSPFAKAPRKMLEAFFSTEFYVRVWPPLTPGDDLEEGLFG